MSLVPNNERSHPLLRDKQGRVLLDVLVVPRAKQSRVVGLHGNRLKIAIKAPPVDGKANEAVCEFVAKLVRVPLRAVTVEHGQTGREKVLAITGITVAEAGARLDEALANA